MLTTGFPASCIIVITASFTGREARRMMIEEESENGEEEEETSYSREKRFMPAAPLNLRII